MAQQADQLHVKLQNEQYGDSLTVRYAGRVDTITTQHTGRFDFNLQLTEPTQMSLSAMPPSRLSFNVVAVPGNTVEIRLTNQYEQGWVTIGGTGFYKNYNEVDTLQYFAQKGMNNVLVELRDRIRKGESQETVSQELYPKYMKAYEEMQRRYMQYINTHNNSELSTLLIPALGDTRPMRQAIDMLSPAVRDGRMKTIFMAPIREEEARAKAEKEAAKKQQEGVEAPDFTLTDINGQPLALSSLRGRFVILDFWGSWCGWCIKGMPKMKEYYAKYSGKFEILGVDCNDTEAKWREAVAKHELPWKHVYCSRDNHKILSSYGIQGFPTKILIDPEGRIAKTVVGEDPSFYDYLDEKFK